MRKTALLLLLVMIFTPSTSYANGIVIEEGTEVVLSLDNRLRSGDDRVGSTIRFTVDRAVVNREGYIVIREGARAYGTVQRSRSAGMLGRSGDLAITIDRVEVFNGQTVRLRGMQGDEGASSTGAVIAGAIVLTPIALLFRGTNAVVEPGTILTAFVDNTTTLSGEPVRYVPAPVLTPAPVLPPAPTLATPAPATPAPTTDRVLENESTDPAVVIATYNLTPGERNMRRIAHLNAQNSRTNQEAFDAFVALVESYNGDYLAAFRAGERAQRMRNNDDARTWFNRALSINPNYRPAINALERL